MATSGSVNLIFSGQSASFEAAAQKVTHSMEGVAERAGWVGETLRAKFEQLPSLLSGGGIEGAIGGLGNLLTGLGEQASTAAVALGPVGVAAGGLVAAASAGAAAVTGLAIAIEKIIEPQMEMITANFKLAESLRVSTDVLKTLQVEAQRTGNVAAEELNSAMTRLARSIGAASEDGGKAERAFQKIGLAAEDLKGIGLDRSFEIIADRVRALSAVEDQAAVLTGIFGKAGARLLPLMLEGSKGIEEARRSLLNYGVAIDSVDSSKVAAATEEFEDLSRRLDGLKNELTVALAPAVMEIGEAFLSIIPDAQTFRQVVESSIVAVVLAANVLKDTVEQFRAISTLGIGGNFHFGESLEDEFNKASKVVADWQADLDAAAAKSREQGEGFASGFASGVEDGVSKVKEAAHHMAESMELSMFKDGDGGDGIGKYLSMAGVDEARIKEVFDAVKAGADHGTISNLAEMAVGLTRIDEAAKSDKAIDELAKKLEGLKAAAEFHVDSSFGEQLAGKSLQAQLEMIKLHDQYEIQKADMEDAARTAKRLGELGLELNAAKAGVSKEDFLAANGTPENAAKIKALEDQLQAAKDAQEKHKKMMEDAKKVYEETRTPVEKYLDTVSKLNQELAAGAIDQDTYNRAVEKAQQTEDKADADELKKRTQNVDKGAGEALVRHLATSVPGTQQIAQELAKRHLDEAQKQSTYQRDIWNVIVNGTGSTDTGISIDSLA